MKFSELRTELRAVITYADLTPEAKALLEHVDRELFHQRELIMKVNEVQHEALHSLYYHYTGEERRKAQQPFDGPDRRSPSPLCPCDKYNHVYDSLEAIHNLVHDMAHADD